MKKTSLIILTVILIITFLPSVFCQEQIDPQKVKDALVVTTIAAQELQKQNNELRMQIQRVADDLTRIKTVTQLDSLKKAYGLIKEKK